MNRFARIVLLVVAPSLGSTTLNAQEEEGSRSTRVGIGVALERTFIVGDDGEAFYLPIGLSNIHVPIVTSAGVLIEPEIGIWRFSESGTDWESSYSSLRIGLGIMPSTRRGRTAIYYGGRVGLIRTKESESHTRASDSRSKTDVYAGAVMGAEYLASDNLGVGAEAQLNYVWVGDFDDGDTSSSAIGNRTLLFVRWYF